MCNAYAIHIILKESTHQTFHIKTKVTCKTTEALSLRGQLEKIIYLALPLSGTKRIIRS